MHWLSNSQTLPSHSARVEISLGMSESEWLGVLEAEEFAWQVLEVWSPMIFILSRSHGVFTFLIFNSPLLEEVTGEQNERMLL